MTGPTWSCQWCWAEVAPDAKSCRACGRLLEERLPYGEALEAALRCPEGLTARRAAYLLGKRRDRHAVSALRRAADEGDPYLAAEAIEALGRIGTPDALALVEGATRHRWVTVRRAAEKALVRRGERDGRC